MLNRTKSFFVVVTLVLGAVIGLPGQSLRAQTSPAEAWSLPQGTTVKDDGPRTYRFSVDYNNANTKGGVQHRQRVTGEYTRGLGDGEVMWKNVAVAEAVGPTAPFGTAQKRDFMEGFRYRRDLDSL